MKEYKNNPQLKAKMCKSLFSWKLNESENRIEIIDHYTNEYVCAVKTVTNDIENVINYIYTIIGEPLLDLKIIYQDTDGIWDTVVPVWLNAECVAVKFEPGI